MTSDLNPGPCSDQIDYDTRGGEIARRNVLFGLWAGHRIGLRGDELETYAWSVHLADHQSPGHDDLIAKVAVDLASCGKRISDRKLRSHLQEMALRASLDLAQRDPRVDPRRRAFNLDNAQRPSMRGDKRLAE